MSKITQHGDWHYGLSLHSSGCFVLFDRLSHMKIVNKNCTWLSGPCWKGEERKHGDWQSRDTVSLRSTYSQGHILHLVLLYHSVPIQIIQPGQRRVYTLVFSKVQYIRVSICTYWEWTAEYREGWDLCINEPLLTLIYVAVGLHELWISISPKVPMHKNSETIWIPSPKYCLSKYDFKCMKQ